MAEKKIHNPVGRKRINISLFPSIQTGRKKNHRNNFPSWSASRQNRRFKRYLERNDDADKPVDSPVGVSMIGQTISSALRWNSPSFVRNNGARTLFSWMAGRSRLPFEFHPIPPLLSRESATLRDRFAFWARRPRLAKKRKEKKKKKSITIRWNSSVGANCPRRESSFAQRCAMKPYSPLRCFTALNADSRT